MIHSSRSMVLWRSRRDRLKSRNSSAVSANPGSVRRCAATLAGFASSGFHRPSRMSSGRPCAWPWPTAGLLRRARRRAGSSGARRRPSSASCRSSSRPLGRTGRSWGSGVAPLRIAPSVRNAVAWIAPVAHGSGRRLRCRGRRRPARRSQVPVSARRPPPPAGRTGVGAEDPNRSAPLRADERGHIPTRARAGSAARPPARRSSPPPRGGGPTRRGPTRRPRRRSLARFARRGRARSVGPVVSSSSQAKTRPTSGVRIAAPAGPALRHTRLPAIALQPQGFAGGLAGTRPEDGSRQSRRGAVEWSESASFCGFDFMGRAGLEPATSALSRRRSPN